MLYDFILLPRVGLGQSTLIPLLPHLLLYLLVSYPFLGRLLRLDLITLVGLKCPSVHKVPSISMKLGMQVEVDE